MEHKKEEAGGDYFFGIHRRVPTEEIQDVSVFLLAVNHIKVNVLEELLKLLWFLVVQNLGTLKERVREIFSSLVLFLSFFFFQ